jgi:hypothetical protein
MHYLIALAFSTQFAALPPDSVNRLRSRARSAEASFERLARTRAPRGWGFGGRECDEIVGRFCLHFDSTSTPPPPVEVGAVIDARREAVESLRRYFSAAPGERDAAGPLVRLLAQDDRAAEAVSAARTFQALTSDTVWGHLLLGYALHVAGESASAEQEYALALARMDEREREAWTDVAWLIDPPEHRVVRRMSGAERAEYERRLWLVSDPFWLTPENERWTEHMARHTEARLLARVPVVTGMLSWGRDLDELAVRYGTPRSRKQVAGRNVWDPSSFVEYYDTAQRAYTPERLHTEGLPPAAFPGDKPPFYAARARSGYALGSVERVLHLPHQATRFLSGEEVVLRVDAALPTPATLADGARAEIGLFVYDSTLAHRLHTTRTTSWAADTTRFSLLLRSPPGTLVYSAELLDLQSGHAARARYRLDAEVPATGPVVSDLLVGAPFGERLPVRRDDAVLAPLHTLVVPQGTTLGVYAEVYRLSAVGPESLRIEFALEPADRPGLLGRLARWMGRATGIIGPESDPRVAWSEEVEAGVHPLAVNLPLDPQRNGRHVLILRITDLGTGETAESRRPLLIGVR